MENLAKKVGRVYRAHGISGLATRLISLPSWQRLAQDFGVAGNRRTLLAQEYLRGEGLEIGALGKPLEIPARARVRYVDRMSIDDLRRQYPELADQTLVAVDIIDDGEILNTIPDGSQDFIVANHFLEHCENPLGALRCHAAKLKPGGILFYAVPDKRYSFDKKRPLTSFEHLQADDREGPGTSRQAHFHEWVRLVMDEREEERQRQAVDELLRINYSIHFHVWNFETFKEFVDRAIPYLDGTLKTECLRQFRGEFLVVLRRV